jgi:hypothetical protein
MIVSIVIVSTTFAAVIYSQISEQLFTRKKTKAE